MFRIIITSLFIAVGVCDLEIFKRGIFKGRKDKEEMATTGFTVGLYDRLNKGTTSNIFYSPASISAAMGMTLLGARGATAEQMKKVMGWGDVLDTEIQVSLSKQFNSLTNKRFYNSELRIANTLFLDSEFKINRSYEKQCYRYYGVRGPTIVDFHSDPVGATETINTWVEDKTNDKITELIPKGGLSYSTVLVIINAIYFKGTWKTQFDPKDTEVADFFISNTKSVKVEMMNVTGTFGYGITETGEECLELPYSGEHFSMFIIKDKNGLKSLEQSLKPNMFKNVERIFAMKQVKVVVSIPKFELEDSFNLSDVLEKMGMTDLFDQKKADLSGIDSTDQLYVNKVLHKSYIKVDEKGSEAAAATSVIINLRSVPFSVRFEANHPFIFFIRHNSTGQILFLGRMYNPNDNISNIIKT